MTQHPSSQGQMAASSRLMQSAFRLEFPQSLGMVRDYVEVQRMVDALADEDFPVQHTLIVGTDLKLVERVTGRQTWGRVIMGGILSGLWMGTFIGLLFGLFTSNWLSMLGTSVLMGIVFFTVWAIIRHASNRGQRDFTSMVSTIPMQYELLVEHRHFADARRILMEKGIALGYGAFGTGDSAPISPEMHNRYGQPSSGRSRQSGDPAQSSHSPHLAHSPSGAAHQPRHRAPHPDDSAPVSAGGSTAAAPDGQTHDPRFGTDDDAPRRPSFGLPAQPGRHAASGNAADGAAPAPGDSNRGAASASGADGSPSGEDPRSR
ncbi:hypothetical protein MHY20_00955 [Helcobacillus sp. ACRRO]|uniref:general stress protein n=1 Tax=Helcobacillus TaxID=1161125 RepID=UPI001EF5883A|nr:MULTISPECIES: general stress protein [Helcobacillus]MCG7426199.1 hypothetical protein [Helcobacillus sp. ACRRO]MDK7742564.1 hypothetical protein [Helcobacillus massiliensis]WOO92274.1 general stress protein [Helcobacillus massiliensis]